MATKRAVAMATRVAGEDAGHAKGGKSDGTLGLLANLKETREVK
jgi:hypothetical protein